MKNHVCTMVDEPRGPNDEQRSQIQKSTNNTKKKRHKKLYDSIHTKSQNRQFINRFRSKASTYSRGGAVVRGRGDDRAPGVQEN